MPCTNMNLKLNLAAVIKNHCPTELEEMHTHTLGLQKLFQSDVRGKR